VNINLIINIKRIVKKKEDKVEKLYPHYTLYQYVEFIIHQDFYKNSWHIHTKKIIQSIEKN